MFGLTEKEMDSYRDAVQFYAGEVVVNILGASKFLAPVYQEKDHFVPDMDFLEDIIDELEDIIKPMTLNMAYEYAYLQCERGLSEDQIIEKIISKYREYFTTELLQKGISFSGDVITKVPVEIMLELPYLYVEIIDVDRLSEAGKDDLLEEKLDAYTKYLDLNIYADLDDEEE